MQYKNKFDLAIAHLQDAIGDYKYDLKVAGCHNECENDCPYKEDYLEYANELNKQIDWLNDVIAFLNKKKEEEE